MRTLLAVLLLLSQEESWVNPPKDKLAGVEHRTFRSASMKRDVGFAIYLPPAYASEPAKRFPVVYYLHGMTDCESTHPQLFGILDAAIAKGEVAPIILVYTMCGRTSWYADAPDGSVMGESVFVKDLVPHVDATFRTVASREGRAVMGWSMGGFGALKMGFKHPEFFGSVVSFGGGFVTGEDLKKRRSGQLKKTFGDDPEKFQEDSPWELSKKNLEKIRDRQPLRLAVGTKDSLLEPNRRMKAFLEDLKLAPEYEEIEGVGHEPPKVFAAQGLKALQFHARHFGK